MREREITGLHFQCQSIPAVYLLNINSEHYVVYVEDLNDFYLASGVILSHHKQLPLLYV